MRDMRRSQYPKIVARVLKFWHEQGYTTNPEIQIRYSKKYRDSAARATGAWHISIVAGKDAHDFECVVLHELVHTVTLKRSDHHGLHFYNVLLPLYKRYPHTDFTYCLRRELGYKPQAVRAWMKAAGVALAGGLDSREKMVGRGATTPGKVAENATTNR